LYDITVIIPANSDDNANSGFKCTHIKFPNYQMQSQRKSCGSELLMKNQISSMYQRPGFESLLNKWVNRDTET
ncbi:13266_t:CDS:2, partial [Funneliformis caledonium]